MFISAVMPIMSIYHLPHGQYGYGGHVINLPQDVTSFASSLPRVPGYCRCEKRRCQPVCDGSSALRAGSACDVIIP